MHRGIQPDLEGSLSRAVGMVERVVNYGTHLIKKCDAAANQNFVAPVFLGLHVVEALDAIAILIRRCSVDPAKLILRSQMEAMFGLSYMALGDTERKSLQYVVGHAHARIDWYKRLDPSTEQGKQLDADIKKDSTFGELDIVGLDTESTIKNLEKMFLRPEYVPVEAEWQRTRGIIKSGKIWWYNLYDGPRNVQGLAEAVNDHGFYQIMYRTYSGEMHATNAMESMHTQQGGKTFAYQPLRYPVGLPSLVQSAVSMALRSYRTLIGMLVPEEMEPYKEWYTTQIASDFRPLDGFRIADPSRPMRMPATRAKVPPKHSKRHKRPRR